MSDPIIEARQRVERIEAASRYALPTTSSLGTYTLTAANSRLWRDPTARGEHLRKHARAEARRMLGGLVYSVAIRTLGGRVVERVSARETLQH